MILSPNRHEIKSADGPSKRRKLSKLKHHLVKSGTWPLKSALLSPRVDQNLSPAMQQPKPKHANGWSHMASLVMTHALQSDHCFKFTARHVLALLQLGNVGNAEVLRVELHHLQGQVSRRSRHMILLSVALVLCGKKMKEVCLSMLWFSTGKPMEIIGDRALATQSDTRRSYKSREKEDGLRAGAKRRP